MLKPKSDQKGLHSGTQRTQQGPGMGYGGEGVGCQRQWTFCLKSERSHHKLVNDTMSLMM